MLPDALIFTRIKKITFDRDSLGNIDCKTARHFRNIQSRNIYFDGSSDTEHQKCKKIGRGGANTCLKSR